jgi:hypothetical protein
MAQGQICKSQRQPSKALNSGFPNSYFMRKIALMRFRLRLWLVAVGLTVTSTSFCQTPSRPRPAWPNPVRFEATNAAAQWAIIGSFSGQVSSDGDTVEVSVESCTLNRPQRFDYPMEVTKIDVSITRDGDAGRWYRVQTGASHPVHQTLNPGQTIHLDPFTLRIPLGDIQILKGDFVTFGLMENSVRDGRPAPGLVYVQVRVPLPVSQAAAAYCADEVTELRSPGREAGFQVIKFCRDSAGRTLTEAFYRPSAGAPNSSAIPSWIKILDPVGNFIYNLDPRNKIAHRSKGYSAAGVFGGVMGGIIGDVPGIPGSPPALKPKIVTQKLGTKMLEGVEVDGTLTTTVYPAGYQGSDHEITATNETWYSYQLKTTVLLAHTDPRYGDNNFHLENIQLGEPDPGLFQVSPDYQVVDQK